MTATSQDITMPYITLRRRSAASLQGGVGSRSNDSVTNATVKAATNHMYEYVLNLAPLSIQNEPQMAPRKPDTIHFWGELDQVVPVAPYVMPSRR